MVLLSVQGMDVAGIAKVTFTSVDRVKEVMSNFNEGGFESRYPKYVGGRPPTESRGLLVASRQLEVSLPSLPGQASPRRRHRSDGPCKGKATPNLTELLVHQPFSWAAAMSATFCTSSRLFGMRRNPNR